MRLRRLRLLLAIAALLPAAVCLASEFDPLEDLYKAPCLVSAPRVSVSPRVEGAFSAADWTSAAAVCGFFDFNTGDILTPGPLAFLAHDAQALSILVLVPVEAGRPLTAAVRERDGPVFTDDSVEAYLQTPRGDLFQICVNSLGALADFRNRDKAWNGSLGVTAGEMPEHALPPEWGVGGERYWCARLRLPFAELGVAPPQPGEEWHVNLAVNRHGPWATLAPIRGDSFAETKAFPALRFLPPDSPFCQLTSLGDVRSGRAQVTGRLVNPSPAPVKCTADLDLRKEGSRLTQDAYRNVIGAIHSATVPLTVAPHSSAPIPLRRDVSDVSLNRLALRVAVLDAAGKPATTLLLQHGPVTVAPPLALRLGNVPSGKYLALEVDASGLRRLGATGTVTLVLEARDEKGAARLTRRQTIPLGVATVRFDYATLPPGRYTLRATALSPAGKPLTTTEAAFRCPTPPVWLTDRTYDDYGTTDRVPLPWTPVRISGRTVSVWGREMSWSPASILPTSIKSQGVELLRRPMALVLTVAGQECPVPLDALQVTGQHKNRVSLTAAGTASGITVNADMWVEYDGFLWVSLRVADAVQGRKVDGLRVVSVLPAAQTTLYQTFCRPLTGWIGDKPIKLPWLSVPGESTVDFYHWLGDEDKGLGFTYTTLRDWSPLSEDNFATIVPGQGEVQYRVNLIEQPASLDGRRFEFGVQATPIKPLPPDYHAMLGATLQYDPWRAIQQIPEAIDATLIWPQETGAMPGLNAPYNVKPDVMRQATKYAHDKGIAFLGMANCPQKVSAQSADFDDYRLEWQALPESVLNWDGVPQVQDCGKSYTLRKWLFYGWAIENVRKFGLDGIYNDGWMAGTMACSNPHHGCGWTDAKGQRHLTVPVLEGREYNHRLLLFLEDNVKSPYIPPRAGAPRPGFPQYHYRIHSWEFVPTVMGFATQWLTGEFTGYPLQGQSMLTPEGTYGKCMGLGLLRSRCLSTNWGVPNTFHALMWEAGEKDPNRQTLMAFAWFLPHGVPLGEITYMNQETVVEIEKLLLAFGTRTATFTPCWRANPYVEIEGAHPREWVVATWDHGPQKPVLVVVSNLEVDKPADIPLRWKGFAGAKVTDAQTGEAVAVTDGKLTVRVEAERFRLLKVER